MLFCSTRYIREGGSYADLMAGARVLRAMPDPATNTIEYVLLHPAFQGVDDFMTTPVYRLVKWEPTLDGRRPVFSQLSKPSHMRNFRMDVEEQEEFMDAPVDRGAEFVKRAVIE